MAQMENGYVQPEENVQKSTFRLTVEVPIFLLMFGACLSISRVMMSSASTPSLKSVPFFVGEFHRARKPALLNRFLFHISRAMMSSTNTPSRKSVLLFVEEFHRARKPALLNRFLVHSQSSYDEQHQYAKSEVCAALRRRVPPCTATSAAEPFSRPHRAMMSSTNTPSRKPVPLFVEEFHRARKPAPLNRFLDHSQSSYDEQHQYAKSQVRAALRRRVPPCTEISAAEPFSRPRSVER
ncbi:hypothetical protein EVAR_78063_1 [Eumeta japonica]|uniref:Uncharacterized protein n=1 Tax=Eumeta variegata TaxID=151549 RepID=A0A4C1T098_EUMVA|nr:hypothetical protein EVAR_78063_1 [Eumeta japonica]